MQKLLFESVNPAADIDETKRSQRSIRGRKDNSYLEPEMTLFGFVETKAQSVHRAKRIRKLLDAIDEAPMAIDCCEQDVFMLNYFIKCSERIEMSPNDRDGLMRMVGDLEELLTESDCQQMLDNKRVWRT